MRRTGLTVAELDLYGNQVSRWMASRGHTHLTDPLDARSRAHYRRMFDLIDTEGSGRVDIDDFRRALRFIGYHVSQKGMTQRMLAVDQNARGALDFNQFLHFMARSVIETSVNSQLLPFYLWIPAFLRRRNLEEVIRRGAAPQGAMDAVRQFAMLDQDIDLKEMERLRSQEVRHAHRMRVAARLVHLEKEFVKRARKRRVALRTETPVPDDPHALPFDDLFAIPQTRQSVTSRQLTEQYKDMPPRARALAMYLDSKTPRGRPRTLPVTPRQRPNLTHDKPPRTQARLPSL